MPFKSIAQKQKWGQLLSEGKVTQAQYDTRENETTGPLPERAAPRRRTVGASRSADAAQFGKLRY